MTSGDESSSEPEREVSVGLKRKRFDDVDDCDDPKDMFGSKKRRFYFIIILCISNKILFAF